MEDRPRRATLRPARALAIALRTGHLAAMAALAGGTWAGLPGPALRGALAATAATGLGLLVSEASHSRHWGYQVRGLLVLLHVGAIGLAGTLGPSAPWVALVLGAVGSHLPKGLRHWSLRHRASID